MLTLYHQGSSVCAAKVRIALHEKGLDWRGVVVDVLKGEQFQDWYLALNPNAVVPTLVDLREQASGYDIEARVTTTARTGVEMEALTAVSAAALTVYDMMKAADRAMVIGEIRLIEKTGGRSGTYRAG